MAWVTRNAIGEVEIFESQPKYDGSDWYHDNPRAGSLCLAHDQYPEVACGTCCELRACIIAEPAAVPRATNQRRARRRRPV